MRSGRTRRADPIGPPPRYARVMDDGAIRRRHLKEAGVGGEGIGKEGSGKPSPGGESLGGGNCAPEGLDDAAPAAAGSQGVFQSPPAAQWDPPVGADGCLRLYEATVPVDWIDYNGHMTEHRYMEAFANANDAILAHVGLDATYLASGRSFYTVETHFRHLGEAKLGERLYATTQVLAADPRRLHVFHRLRRVRDDALIATGEHLFLHVDQAAGRCVAAGPEVAERLAAAAAAHAHLPRPHGAGRSVGMPR